jgi:hypothetical protein
MRMLEECALNFREEAHLVMGKGKYEATCEGVSDKRGALHETNARE